MSQGTEEIKPAFGGLNSDDEDRALQVGDYRYALNVHNGSSDSSNIGTIENLKGNEQVSFTLEAGTNTCIGQVEDKRNQQTYFFIHNSNGDHGIYKYIAQNNIVQQVLVEPNLNFDLDHLITHADIVGEDKLYWTDNFNPPRKINVDKANDTGKFRKFNMYFGVYQEDVWEASGVTYNLKLVNPLGTTVYLANFITIPAGAITYSEVARLVTKAINEDVTLQTFITAESCGPFVEVTFLQQGKWRAEMKSTNLEGRAVPQNYYESPLLSEQMSQMKPPPNCEPTFTMTADPSREVNYLLKKNFQFRARYEYDDFEKSVLGPVSCLTTDIYSCDASVASSPINCIEIDFTDVWLNDQGWLSTIKKVALFVREGNDGNWKLITTLEQFDIGAKDKNVFRFYNDQSYSAISSEEGIKLFDSVPLLSRAQELAKDRLFHGDTLESYDEVCVDADVNITYNAVPDIETYNISGRILITNPLNPLTFGPIWDEDALGGSIRWGGLEPNGGAPSSKESTAGTAYGQTIPREGFTVYLAGTDYSALTRQNPAPGVTFIAGTRNVYDGSTLALRNAIRNAMDNADVYSTFELENVPVGKYILRIASHQIEGAEGLYQRTSTTVFQTGGTGVGSQGSTEVEIEVTSTEIIVNGIPQGSHTVPPSYIQDVTNYTILLNSIAVGGYCTDKDVTSLDTGTHTYEEYLSDTRIDRCQVEVNTNLPDTDNQVIADHNGFFHYVDYSGGGVKTMTINPAQTIAGVIQTNPNEFDTSGNPWTSVSAAQMDYIVLRNTNALVSSDSRTKIEGQVDLNTGGGLFGINVVPAFAQPVRTDVNGAFSAIVYADSPGTNRQGNIFPSLVSTACIAEFTPDQLDINAPGGITINSLNFNFTTPYAAGTIVAEIIAGLPDAAFKRGGDFQFGIVYYDFGNRQNAVNTGKNLEKHILFYTEKDENGNQVPFGKPSLDWTLRNLPPSWATHYQWVRTKNTGTNDYLQFVVKSVEYQDDDGATASFATGTRIVLDLSNIDDYKTRFPNSQVGIAADTEYRVRFIKDDTDSFYPEYIDLEVIDATGSTVTVYVDNALGQVKEGVLIEVYRPLLDAEFKFYYEIGECHEIIDGFHQGETQDQFHWNFDDNQDVTGNLGLVSVIPHKFQIGDEIFIEQAPGFTHSSYEGFATIIGVPDQFNVTTNKAFAGATPAEPGTAKAHAEGVFEKGDAYYRLRTMGTETEGDQIRFIDDASVSDFFLSEHQSIGRIQVENPDQAQLRREAHLRFTGKIFLDTKVNNLNSFNALDGKSLEKENGSIYKLQRAENVLLAIQEFRWTSVYVEERITTQQDGTDSIIATDEVIGATRELQGKWGTVNPESVDEYEGHVWAWDVNKGEVIRYSANGLQPISEYKMSNFFGKKAEDFTVIDDRSTYKVYGVYDPFFEEYIMSFAELNTTLPSTVPADTIAFSERLTRWTAHYSFIPEMMGKVGQKVISWLGGDLWVHNKLSTYNNFYGVQYTSQIDAVWNEIPKKIKIWKAVSVESNEVWTAPSLDIPVSEQNPNGMNTNIVEARFIRKEGIYYAEMPRDLNTPGSPTDPILNGREMRGHVIQGLFENDKTTLVVLHAINVIHNYSEKSG